MEDVPVLGGYLPKAVSPVRHILLHVVMNDLLGVTC